MVQIRPAVRLDEGLSPLEHPQTVSDLELVAAAPGHVGHCPLNPPRGAAAGHFEKIRVECERALEPRVEPNGRGIGGSNEERQCVERFDENSRRADREARARIMGAARAHPGAGPHRPLEGDIHAYNRLAPPFGRPKALESVIAGGAQHGAERRPEADANPRIGPGLQAGVERSNQFLIEAIQVEERVLPENATQRPLGGLAVE